MSKNGGDLKVVFRGLQILGRTVLDHEANRIRSACRNSSARPILNDAVRTFRANFQGGNKNKDVVVKKGTVWLSRASMITEGIGQYVRFVFFDSRLLRSTTPTDERAADADVRRRMEDNSDSEKTARAHVEPKPSEAPVAPVVRSPVMKPAEKEPAKVVTAAVEKKRPLKTPNLKLSEKSKERKVPSSRIGRLVSYGSLAAGLGFGALAEATKRTFTPWSARNGTAFESNVLLTDANAERIVNTLCRVRGAALKIGQMLSLQDESMISPQLMKILERVRHSADFMPQWQTEKVLEQELGQNWRSKMASFESRPFAAASIGQVHLAQLHDGRQVAVKIQYPGVAAGIESDIRNLMTTLKVWKILPTGLFIDNLMAVASRELALEVDYTHETKYAKKFKEILKQYPQFVVPEVIDSLSTREVMTTELVEGLTLDKCVDMDQDIRDYIGTELFRLTFMELYDLRCMQTDPNWSNFLYDSTTRKIALLDFGASRDYSKLFVDRYARVVKAAVDGDREAVLSHSRTIGFLTGYETKVMENAHVDATMIMGEAFQKDEPFDFGGQDITRRIREVVPIMMDHRLTPPPEEIYSLHRKLSGIFLLCGKLRARVNCGRLFKAAFDRYRFDDDDVGKQS